MNVIHRTTLRYLESVNTPDYPEPTWKWGPDMSQVAGVSPLYWKWDAVNERPIPMTAGEQAAVNATLLSNARDSAVTQFANVENAMRAFLLVLLDELNLHATKQSEELADIAAATSLADYKTRRAARTAVPQRTEQQLRTAIRNKLGT